MDYLWLKKITGFDELPEEYRDLISLVGVDKFIQMMRTFDKTSVYFSKKGLMPLLQKYIVENQTVSAQKLAKELNISVRYVYKLKTLYTGSIETEH